MKVHGQLLFPPHSHNPLLFSHHCLTVREYISNVWVVAYQLWVPTWVLCWSSLLSSRRSGSTMLVCAGLCWHWHTDVGLIGSRWYLGSLRLSPHSCIVDYSKFFKCKLNVFSFNYFLLSQLCDSCSQLVLSRDVCSVSIQLAN